MKNSPHPCLALVLALVCTLAIAACGGGATTTVTVTEPASATPPASEKPTKSKEKNDGETVIGDAGVVAGYVDNVIPEPDSIKLLGWAATPDLSGPANKVSAVVSGKTLAEAVPAIERSDVAEALGKPGITDSGFELHLPIEKLECGTVAAGIEVVGELKGDSGPLEFGEGIKAKLTEAC